jgi:UDP-N-acetylglucosamine 2-epimerase (non-hydrolysing)
MEAGNRSFDANVPEEVNRKFVDHLADFNLVYTEHARRHLLSEGLPHRFIYMTGSPMREVMESRIAKIEMSTVLEDLQLESKKYFIVSIHREENVDSRSNLTAVLDAFQAMYNKFGFPIIVSTHPRTHSRLKGLSIDLSKIDIRFLKPFGFFDYNKLQLDSFCAISDSGTISEESAILGFPAVTLRNSIERPEAIDAGSIILTGLRSDVLLKAIDVVTTEDELFREKEIPEEYRVKNTSLRVLKLITGTAKLTKKWKNMDEFNRYDWDLS